MTEYIVECGDVRKVFTSLGQALRYAVANCSNEVRVYRTEPVLSITVRELEELREILGVEVGKTASEAAGREVGRRGARCVAAIFDQMFRGFAEVVDRELRDLCLELHEVIGRGLEKTVRVGERIFREPARDDYDVLSLAERLAKRLPVVLFTGDRKLAEQASMIKNVYVEYMPPNEYAGKEMAVKHMIAVLRRLAEG